jgi:hypothetical protein
MLFLLFLNQDFKNPYITDTEGVGSQDTKMLDAQISNLDTFKIDRE